jgi:hypothetical protein
MLQAEKPPWVQYHNIVGVLPDEGFLGSLAAGTDGVVAFESAHLQDAASEIKVNADHSTVHRHPLSVLEVRRILLEHVDAVNSFPIRNASTRTPESAHRVQESATY